MRRVLDVLGTRFPLAVVTDGPRGVLAIDTETGAEHRLRARVVVNAAGQPAQGVRVCALDTASCATSDARGAFRIGDLRAGQRVLERAARVLAERDGVAYIDAVKPRKT